MTSPVNPGKTIVVKNMSGQPTNFGLYKSDKLLTTQQDVGVGSIAMFQLTPNLYFAVMRDIRSGTVFNSLSITQNYFRVDLNDFANGLIVRLNMNRASGEYMFRAEQANLPFAS